MPNAAASCSVPGVSVIGVHTRVHTHTPLSHKHKLIPPVSFSHLPSTGAASAEEEVVSDRQDTWVYLSSPPIFF